MPRIVALPALDTPALAEEHRRNLDLDRHDARRLGEEALAAIRSGQYRAQSGELVDWYGAVEAARALKLSLRPEASLPSPPRPVFPETGFQVANLTTLEAARLLGAEGLRPLALNFANGIHPGGGWLSGSRAQEEFLCRSSALFATLDGDGMYAAHAQRPTPDSTSWAILSPRVPVFRDDAGKALESFWLLDFLTCAAPVAKRLGAELSAPLMDERIRRVLAIARAYGYTGLVLGAWGCGAFGNDPSRTAGSFMAALTEEFAGDFARVVFAITDWSPERTFLAPFRDELARLRPLALPHD